MNSQQIVQIVKTFNRVRWRKNQNCLRYRLLNQILPVWCKIEDMRRIAGKRCQNSCPRSTNAVGMRQKHKDFPPFQNLFFTVLFGLCIFVHNMFQWVKWLKLNWEKGRDMIKLGLKSTCEKSVLFLTFNTAFWTCYRFLNAFFRS